MNRSEKKPYFLVTTKWLSLKRTEQHAGADCILVAGQLFKAVKQEGKLL